MSKPPWYLPPGRVTRTPVKLRFDGVEPGSPLARQLGEMLHGQIKRFYLKAAQAHAAGVTTWTSQIYRTPDLAIRYVNNHGEEILHVRVSPEVLLEAHKRVIKPEPWEWLLIDFIAPTLPETYMVQPQSRCTVTAPSGATAAALLYQAGSVEADAFAPAAGLSPPTVTTDWCFGSHLVHVGALRDVPAWRVACDAVSVVTFSRPAAPIEFGGSLVVDHAEALTEALAAMSAANGGTFIGATPAPYIGNRPDGSGIPVPSVAYDYNSGDYSWDDATGTTVGLGWYDLIDGYMSPNPILFPDHTWMTHFVALLNGGHADPVRPNLVTRDPVRVEVSAYPFRTKWKTQSYTSAIGSHDRFLLDGEHGPAIPKPWVDYTTSMRRFWTGEGGLDPLVWTNDDYKGDAILYQPLAIPGAVQPGVTFKHS